MNFNPSVLMKHSQCDLIKSIAIKQGLGEDSGIDLKLVFQAKDWFVRKDYYQVKNKEEKEYFILYEFHYSARETDEEESIAVYQNFDKLMEGLKNYKYNGYYNSKLRGQVWWSYCEDWLCLEPVYVNDSIKPLLKNELIRMLSEVSIEDIHVCENERFLLWMDFLK
jgi:hypothetical protein